MGKLFETTPFQTLHALLKQSKELPSDKHGFLAQFFEREQESYLYFTILPRPTGFYLLTLLSKFFGTFSAQLVTQSLHL